MNIKEEREKRGWSKSELARRLGNTQLTVRRWEQGKTKPSLMAQVLLKMVFGIKGVTTE